jgi:hypothetical protein
MVPVEWFLSHGSIPIDRSSWPENLLSLNHSSAPSGSFLDPHCASLHQNPIAIFDEHNQVAILSSEKFSHSFRERQLISCRDS